MLAARDPRDVASMVSTTFMFLSYGNFRIKLLQSTFYRTIGNLAYRVCCISCCCLHVVIVVQIIVVIISIDFKFCIVHKFLVWSKYACVYFKNCYG